MKNLLSSVIIAFSTYSKFPMPQVEWDNRNMRYTICFFPLVGVAIGLCLLLWYYLSQMFLVSEVLFSAVATAIPVIITGGIHMDGFCDTIDALSSHKPAEIKLEILKDPNAGAFAVIKTGIYFILYFALFYEINSMDYIYIIAIGYVLERALSGLAITFFKTANKSGLANTFAVAADKKIAAIMFSLYILICFVLMIAIDLKTGILVILFSILVFIYYKKVAYKYFGGITGDLAGYFLQLCEVFTLVAIVISKLVLI